MGGAGQRRARNNAAFLLHAEDRAHAPAVGCSNAQAPTQVTITHPSSWRRAATAAGGCCYGRSPAFREGKAERAKRKRTTSARRDSTSHTNASGTGPAAPGSAGPYSQEAEPDQQHAEHPEDGRLQRLERPEPVRR